MRKLPSRAAKAKKNDITAENLDIKNKTKKSPIAKLKKKQTRQVLADKTNSGSDSNQSPSSISPIYSSNDTRPKRVRNLPSKFIDHELDVKKCNVRTSTPLKNKAIPRNDKEKSNKNIKNTPKKNTPIDTDKFKSPVKSPKIKERPKRIVKVAETPKSTDKPIVSKNTIYNKSNVSSGSTKQIPIYKNLSILNNSQDNISNKLEHYDFQFDPESEPVKPKKKRIIRKNKPVKKKKVLSSSSSDDAMRMLLEDLKKIQAANLLKKLRLKKKLKSKEAAAVVNPDENQDRVDEIPDRIDSPPGSPVYDMDANPSPPPSPILLSKNTSRSIAFDQNDNHFIAPIANSSANPINKPCASPWRMDLKSDKKWAYNFSVKASMTPSYERDTVHVLGFDHPKERPKQYGNMLELLTSTPVVQNAADNPEKNYKQSSILSFYEKSLNKSARKKSPKKNVVEHSSEDIVIEVPPKENEVLAVSNCFGFEDDSEEFDQENVSPTKLKNVEAKIKNILKHKNRIKMPLRENNVNVQGPARVTPFEVRNILVTKKVNNIPEEPVIETPTIVDELPVVEQVNTSSESDVENTTDNNTQADNDVALFEDPVEIELVHSIKPTRKIYEKRKRPVVRFQEIEKSASNEEIVSDHESAEDDFAAEKYVSKKKKIKKKPTQNKLSKKEEKEAAEWAAGFNSLLEEAEEYELCVE